MKLKGFKMLACLGGLGLMMTQTAQAQAFDYKQYAQPQVMGQQSDSKLEEVSGLAVAHSRSPYFWAINDGGNSPSLMLLDGKGKFKSQLNLEQLGNHDWEDLETFVMDGKNYIAIADIGDNFSRRKVYYVHLVPEPKIFPDGQIGPVSREQIKTIAFQYEDGPRDAEALGIDLLNKRILLLTKRDAPPRMYSLPLIMQPQRFVYRAKHLTDMNELGQMSFSGDYLTQTLYAGMPTSITVMPDQLTMATPKATSLAVLSYGAVWFFDLINKEPPSAQKNHMIKLPAMPQAEAMAVDAQGEITVLSEITGSNMIRIPRLM